MSTYRIVNADGTLSGIELEDPSIEQNLVCELWGVRVNARRVDGPRGIARAVKTIELCADGLCMNDGAYTYLSPADGRRVVLCTECLDHLREQAAIDGLDLAALAIAPLSRAS